MTNPHDLLDIPADATPAQAKAAYHKKLREFPAHTHPAQFKAVRSAYESIQNASNQPDENFFTVRPLDLTIEPAVIADLKKKLTQHLEVSLEDMLRGTF